LILAGAAINARDNDGKTALTQPKGNERVEVAKLLESYGAQEL
jgi:ankyrin repeat protein